MRVSPFFMISLFEFRRHLDIRGEVAGLLLLAVIALVKLGGDAILARESAAVVHLDARGTPVAGLSEGRFHFSDALGDGVSGDPPILSSVAGDYILHTEQPPGWLGELQRSLDTLHRQHSLSMLGVTRDQLRKVDSPVSLRVIDSQGTAVFADTSLTAVSIAMVVLTTLAILGCLGMIFQGLLGERFGHATEMILSAAPPGLWLDCKVAASILHGLKTVAVYGVYGAIGWTLMSGSASGDATFAEGSWKVMLGLLVFCLLGLMLWNWFFAACATAIRSPHSAFRNTLPAFPLTMIMIGFAGLRTPDGAFMHVMSLFPFTSMAAMPVRLLYVNVPIWEIALSLSLLAFTAALLRKWARSNFRTAIVSPVEPTHTSSD